MSAKSWQASWTAWQVQLSLQQTIHSLIRSKINWKKKHLSNSSETWTWTSKPLLRDGEMWTILKNWEKNWQIKKKKLSWMFWITFFITAREKKWLKSSESSEKIERLLTFREHSWKNCCWAKPVWLLLLVRKSSACLKGRKTPKDMTISWSSKEVFMTSGHQPWKNPM